MSDSQEPPWHLLPHSTRAFFGLPNGATREQLKQAYSLLIRRYKPDKFPNEFKRIRAAYEQLDLEFQSGQKPVYAPEVDDSSTVHPPNFQDKPPSELSSRAAAYQRIQDNDPENWYRELSEKSQKTEHDYYLLAILSEVVELDSKGFADWIAQGLAQHQYSQDLSDLLQAYFKGAQFKPERASALLLRLAEALPAATYYTLTDALWHRYISMVPWETFQGVLGSCERFLGIRVSGDRKAFTVILMRWVMWRAPLEWLHEKRKWIEESVEAIPSHMEFDHEINCRLLLLREQFLDQLQRGPYGQRILDAIVSFCQEGMDASAKVCACQVQIANHPREFLAEFEYQPEDQIQWSFAWHWISWAVSTRLATQEEPADQDRQLEFIASIKDRMDKSTPPSIFGVGLIMTFFGMILLPYALFLFCVTVFGIWLTLTVTLFGNRTPNEWGYFGFLFNGLIMVRAYLFFLPLWDKSITRWDSKVIEPYLKRCFSKEYRTKWRYSVAHSMQVLACPYQTYISMVRHLCAHGDGLNVLKLNVLKGPSIRLASFLENDLGLTLLCAAVSFAR
jgi:hypothetical protein